MDIVDAVLQIPQTIGNWFGILMDAIGDFFNPFVSICGYILEIIKSIGYGIGSLTSALWSLLLQIFEGGVFFNVGNAFSTLSHYIGAPAVIFIATLLLVIIFRIVLSFIFKIIKLNANYKPKTPGEKDYTIINIKK